MVSSRYVRTPRLKYLPRRASREKLSETTITIAGEDVQNGPETSSQLVSGSSRKELFHDIAGFRSLQEDKNLSVIRQGPAKPVNMKVVDIAEKWLELLVQSRTKPLDLTKCTMFGTFFSRDAHRGRKYSQNIQKN